MKLILWWIPFLKDKLLSRVKLNSLTSVVLKWNLLKNSDSLWLVVSPILPSLLNFLLRPLLLISPSLNLVLNNNFLVRLFQRNKRLLKIPLINCLLMSTKIKRIFNVLIRTCLNVLSTLKVTFLMILSLWMCLTTPRLKPRKSLLSLLMLKSRQRKLMKRENNIVPLLLEVLLFTLPWLKSLSSIGCITLLLNNSLSFSLNLLIFLKRLNFPPTELKILFHS